MSETTTATAANGAAAETTEQPSEGQGEAHAPTAEDIRKLTDALDNERKRREATQTELDELRKAAMSDNEKALNEAKEAGRAEAMSEVNGRLLAAEVRAMAADKLADPGDAVRLLDLDELANRDGSPDAKAIAAAIDKLVEAKPYLAKKTAPPASGTRPPQGARDDGGSDTADDFIRRSVRGT